jgi:hypothetical protein
MTPRNDVAGLPARVGGTDMRIASLSSVLAALFVAGSAAFGQMSVAVPSGQAIEFFEQRVDDATGAVRLRFLAPDLDDPLKRPSFEDITLDLEMLCREFGVKTTLEDGLENTQIVISLSSEKVEYGVINSEVEQVFEAFSVQNGTCMLEIF